MKKYNLIIIVTFLFTLGCELEKDNTLPTKLVDNSWAEGIYFFEYKVDDILVSVDPYVRPSITRSDTLEIFLESDNKYLSIYIDGFTGKGIYTDKVASTKVAIGSSQYPFCGHFDIEIDSFVQGLYVQGTFNGGVTFLLCDDPPSSFYTDGKFTLLNE